MDIILLVFLLWSRLGFTFKFCFSYMLLYDCFDIFNCFWMYSFFGYAHLSFQSFRRCPLFFSSIFLFLFVFRLWHFSAMPSRLSPLFFAMFSATPTFFRISFSAMLCFGYAHYCSLILFFLVSAPVSQSHKCDWRWGMVFLCFHGIATSANVFMPFVWLWLFAYFSFY